MYTFLWLVILILGYLAWPRKLLEDPALAVHPGEASHPPLPHLSCPHRVLGWAREMNKTEDLTD